jgi:hypothetical protein
MLTRATAPQMVSIDDNGSREMKGARSCFLRYERTAVRDALQLSGDDLGTDSRYYSTIGMTTAVGSVAGGRRGATSRLR